jgi:hypothetical protein
MVLVSNRNVGKSRESYGNTRLAVSPSSRLLDPSTSDERHENNVPKNAPVDEINHNTTMDGKVEGKISSLFSAKRRMILRSTL